MLPPKRGQELLLHNNEYPSPFFPHEVIYPLCLHTRWLRHANRLHNRGRQSARHSISLLHREIIFLKTRQSTTEKLLHKQQNRIVS